MAVSTRAERVGHITVVYRLERPWTHNQERSMHYAELARRTKKWRDLTGKTVANLLENASAYVGRVSIDTMITRKNGSSMPDGTASAGAVKAMIDGLVQGGLLPDDSPRYVGAVTYHRPAVTGRDGLILAVRPWSNAMESEHQWLRRYLNLDG